MMYYIWIALVLSACSQINSAKTEKLDNIELQTSQDNVPEKLASGFKWAEGPASDSEGNIYFTDVRKSNIFVWTINQQLDTFRVNSGGANGLYFDKDENLLACEVRRGRITKTSPKGEYEVVTDNYQGKPFNETNDLWIDKKGGIYFTDPKFGRNNDEMSQDGMHVYYLKPDGSSVLRVCDDFEKPNGLVGTLDGKILYVTDVQAGKTYQYNIQEDGLLTSKKLFANYGCDGMTIDKKGNVYLTTAGNNAVDVFSPKGKLIQSIKIPERASNVCFSKKNENQLFITGESSIYSVNLNLEK